MMPIAGHAAIRLAVIALVAAPALAAPKDKPALTVTTQSIAATVTIDPALRAYRGLYRDLLAEGKRELAKERAQAGKDRKELPDIFRAGRRYAFGRTYTLRSVVGRYVGVVYTDFLDSLGAHPNHAVDTILWDSDTDKRVSIRPFFKETTDDGPTLRALAAAVRDALAAEKKKRGVPVGDPQTDPALSGVKPTLLGIGAVALAPSTDAGRSSGLVFYFSPYAVGAYVEGSYVVFVPWQKFKGFLSPEGAALFGGERPPGDAERDKA